MSLKIKIIDDIFTCNLIEDRYYVNEILGNQHMLNDIGNKQAYFTSDKLNKYFVVIEEPKYTDFLEKLREI